MHKQKAVGSVDLQSNFVFKVWCTPVIYIYFTALYYIPVEHWLPCRWEIFGEQSQIFVLWKWQVKNNFNQLYQVRFVHSWLFYANRFGWWKTGTGSLVLIDYFCDKWMWNVLLRTPWCPMIVLSLMSFPDWWFNHSGFSFYHQQEHPWKEICFCLVSSRYTMLLIVIRIIYSGYLIVRGDMIELFSADLL